MLSHINIGTGTDMTIKELAGTIKDVVGFTGKLVFDSTKPDGAPRKLMGVDLLSRIGWSASTSLADGLQIAYQKFQCERRMNDAS